MNQPFLKFQGIEQQQKYEKRIEAFPEESLERLKEIFSLRDRKKHIELSEKYSAIDDNVKWVDSEIRGLVAQKSGNDQSLIELATEKLTDLRRALTSILKVPFGGEQSPKS